jgi:hypothetical protein
MQALALQQALVEAPPLELARGGAAAERVRALAQRLGVRAGGAGDDAGAAFAAVLDRAVRRCALLGGTAVA